MEKGAEFPSLPIKCLGRIRPKFVDLASGEVLTEANLSVCENEREREKSRASVWINLSGTIARIVNGSAFIVQYTQFILTSIFAIF